ncbi:hypothetical protein ACFV2L_18885 [Streptomyces sp. NPDC059687]|uniref:hypothetical protein n=1 Tax=Streptomyces sp. NPDC059687 TaxID=3346905 RepID=UPI0036924361
MINQPLEARIRVRDEIVADPRVVAAVVEAVNTQVPVYAALDDSRLPEVRAIAAWGVDRLLDLWASDGTLGPADLRRFRGIAAARAADGRPVQAVLRAYRVAAAVVTDEVAARAHHLTAKDGLSLARVLLTALDTLSEEMATAYAATTEDLAGDRDRALRLLLDDLVAGRHASVGARTDRSARLGVHLPDPYCLLVAEPVTGEGPDMPYEAAAGLVGALADGGTALSTVRGPRAVVLPRRPSTERRPCSSSGAGGAARSPAKAWTGWPSPTGSPPTRSTRRPTTPIGPAAFSPTPTHTCSRCSPGIRPSARTTSPASFSAH